VLEKTARSQTWQDEMKKLQLVDHYLDSKAAAAFLDAENAKLGEVMAKLGLSKQAAVK
jgi:tripartite-type tricarboxylate transporter receptor subunit TctC